MKVLIACEESQTVCKAFRELGFDAYSCDLIDCSGGHPEWHLKCDALSVLHDHWDLIIAHPPCTYLTVTGNRWFDVSRYGDRALQRFELRDLAARFFMEFVNCDCPHVAIENPIGYMSTYYRKPDQIIQPFYFGDPARKATCLWLKGLPLLVSTSVVEPIIVRYKNGKGTDNPWHIDSLKLPKDERARYRSKTFPGIAAAMASQWSAYLLNHQNR